MGAIKRGPKSHLNKEQLNRIKFILQKEKEKLVFRGTYVSEEFNLDEEDLSDEIDQANADVHNADRLRFRNREVFYIKKIDQALKRMEKNEYGVCEECDMPIKYERLCARPTAELCVICKEESERDESHNILGRQSKSLGKAVNLVAPY